MKNSLLFIILLVVLFSCSQGDSSSKAKELELIKEKKSKTDTDENIDDSLIIVEAPIDTVQTALAYYMAGIKPVFKTPLDSLFAKEEWLVYKNEIDAAWKKTESGRLEQLKSWSKSELSKFINDTLPLFYPFSGPDFLHANCFYPEAADYFMIAIEPVLSIPDIQLFKSTEEKLFLKSLKSSLRDVLGKSYFITTHMMEDLKESNAQGVLPLIYTFLARTNHEIIKTYPVQLDSLGQIFADDTMDLEGSQAVRIEMRKKGDHKIKSITYFNRSISDRDLERKHPHFNLFLKNNIPTCNSFVKAASYLMHYRGFGVVRDAIIKKAECVFQDDTGIPLRYLDTTQWELRLYGEYTRPIKDFTTNMYQPDMKALYDKTPAEQKYDIPFTLGYHIVGDKIQNHQIITRK